MREAISMWEQKMKTASGKDAFTIKKTLIELRKDQYVIKNAYRRPIIPNKLIHQRNILPLDGEIALGKDGSLISSGIVLTDPAVCSAILCNYSKLKEDSWGDFESDMWYLLTDFDAISGVALEPYPLYLRLVEYKVDGMQNIDIQKALEEEFGIKHSIEYISSLFFIS